jgi:acetyl esterase/lipase
MELGTQVMQGQLAVAFRMGDVKEARRYLDSVDFGPSVPDISIKDVCGEIFRGHWFAPKHADTRVTLLYFHGGGYSFYPRAYTRFIAQITLAAKSRTFALDYRLSPEHRFPAQLEDALSAYRWLLAEGTQPEDLVVAGDSAGGNLTLALLLSLRDARLPLPALAIALSPATDFEDPHRGIPGDPAADWIEPDMLQRWADWFCDPAQRGNPLVSPVRADLRGLPPLYIQAGRAEILYPSIKAFADRAGDQGLDVVLESWEDMNHDFQMFGPDVPQSAKALRRLGEVVDSRIRKHEQSETASRTSL